MAYLLRDGSLAPITTPQQEGDTGKLTNHLGLGEKMEIERVRFLLQPGDTILLCTDGISGYLSEAEILTALSSDVSPEICVDVLMAKALEMSEDNTTAVVAKVPLPSADTWEE